MEARQHRILLIDDSANDLAVTRRSLERSGYDVVTALSGEEGLHVAAETIPDVIVVDYRMPVMDGFEVTRRIKADPALRTIPVLMLTGADSTQFVVNGLKSGADDYVTKGSDREILFARLEALLRVKEYQDQLRRANQQMSRDLQIARRVQEALVPQRSFCAPGMEIRSAYIPSEALSGDFYDYFLLDDTTFLFVADVSGHGLPAAILVSLLKSYIHTESNPTSSLATFMARLNDFFYSVSLPSQYATAQLFRMQNGNLTYANAAHPPFLLHSRKSGKTSIHEQPGHLLGALPKMPFEEHRMQVAAGDTLFVYTDGLTDRRNASGEFYSVDRIAALLDKSPEQSIDNVYDSIYQDVSAFTSVEDFKDDIAFVLTRFN